MSMDELQIGAGTPDPFPPAIVGEAEAGRAAKVRKEITKLVNQTNEATFNLMDLLHEAKVKNYYRDWGFETFSNYAKSLNLKYSKSFYLVKIRSAMLAAGLTREEYEPIGLGKLRVIAKLDPESEYNGTPGSLVIRELTLKAGQLTHEEVQLEVDTLMGFTADESLVWLNINLKKLARDNVIRPALDKAKKHLPQTTDEEGKYVDASDGAALEVICANFLADPNFDDDPSEPSALTPAGEAYVVSPGEAEPTTEDDSTTVDIPLE